MSNLLKKFAFSILSALILFFSVAPSLSVHAAFTSTWYDQTPGDFFTKVYDSTNPSEIFGERYTAAQVQWVIYSILSFPVTVSLGQGGMRAVACFFNTTSGQFNLNQCLSSLTAQSTPATKLATLVKPTPVKQNLWSMVFADRPLSGISYVRHKIEDFSLVPVAHAQVVGFGFDALQPVQGMWSAMRDIAFSLFAIIAVIFAFLIMFRVKLSPQTVITVQSALPKIIVAIIVVTFSYAIAGFLIDFMYVVIGLLSVVSSRMFSPIFGAVMGPPQYFSFLTLGQPLGMNLQFGVIGLIVAYLIFFYMAFILVFAINLGAVGIGLVALFSGALLVFATPVAVFLLILLLIIAAVAFIAAIWHSVKIFWTLLKAFVSVILLTIFAPLQLTLGILIPNFGFGAWVKSYLSALSTFVVTGILILFSYAFLLEGVIISINSLAGGSTVGDIFHSIVLALGGTNAITTAFAGQGAWPPLLGTGGGGYVGLLFLGVSFVIYTTIPKSAELVQSFIQGKQFAYGTAIGQAMAPFGVGWNLFGAPLWNTAAKNREEDYIENTFGNVRKRLGPDAGNVNNPHGYSTDLDRAGIKVPKNLYNEIHQLNETLTKGKG